MLFLFSYLLGEGLIKSVMNQQKHYNFWLFSLFVNSKNLENHFLVIMPLAQILFSAKTKDEGKEPAAMTVNIW